MFNLREIHLWHTVSVAFPSFASSFFLQKALCRSDSKRYLSAVSPQVFAAVGAGQQALLISGFFGVVKVVSCLFFLLFLVERIGRRNSLIGGGFMMGCYMLIIAVLTVVYPPKANAGLTSPAIASLTMIYLEASTYLFTQSRMFSRDCRVLTFVSYSDV